MHVVYNKLDCLHVHHMLVIYLAAFLTALAVRLLCNGASSAVSSLSAHTSNPPWTRKQKTPQSGERLLDKDELDSMGSIFDLPKNLCTLERIDPLTHLSELYGCCIQLASEEFEVVKKKMHINSKILNSHINIFFTSWPENCC